VDRGVLRLPDEVSYDEASFVEPLGCVVRGQRLAGLQAADSVLVMGSGITGLLHIQLARALGAGRIIASDISDFRLKAASGFGAAHAVRAGVVAASYIRGVNDGRLADMVIVCTGAQSAVEGAFKLVEPGGTILFFAPSGPDAELRIPFNEFWWSGIKTVSSYAAAPSDLALALELIRAKRVDVGGMVTHRLALSETQEGFRMVEDAQDSIKVIIDPSI
jgi:L-iditol 2-dehydrogenase